MRTLSKILRSAAAALLLSGVLLSFCAVIFRYVLNNSIVWSEEAIRYTFIWMFFLAMPEATRQGAHIALDLVSSKLHGKARLILDVVVEAVCVCFDCVLVYYGIIFSLQNMKQVTAAIGIPYGYINLAIPVGGFLMLLFSIRRIVMMLQHKRDEDMADFESEKEDKE
ncbi:MAG: TRAP transporter small permease [Oscillospiraceae bacterium]|nr:TRAP transporter small permease [Oscillospiraceae bacterium]